MHTHIDITSIQRDEARADSQARDTSERSRARAMLVEQYGIESMFVRVPTLSKVMGLAAPTIYSSMRAGRFVIPHRMLNSSPAVKLEDLLDWYCGAPGVEAIDAEDQTATVSDGEDSSSVALSNADAELEERRPERDKARSQRIISNVMASMRKRAR